MELNEYLAIIRKRTLLIVIITFVATLISGVVSFFVIKPMYKADISVIIGKQDAGNAPKNMEYSEVMMYQQLVQTYGQIAKSRTVAEDVINSLNLNIKVDSLINMISVAPKANTMFLTITVKSGDPKQSMDVANQLAKSLKKVSSMVQRGDNVQLLDEALMPQRPDSPKPFFNMAVAFFIGLMISFGVAFLLEYLDNTVKTSEDIEKLIDVPVIGLIPLVEKND